MPTAELQRSRWIFFDVGYTLLDETNAWNQQLDRLVIAAGGGCTRGQFWQTYHRACVTFAPRQWQAVVQAAAPSPDDVPRLMRLAEDWRHDLEQPYPGVCEALKLLSARYKLGIIANQSAGTRDRLLHHGMLDSISLVIGSAEAGVSKPDPAIFQRALREADCPASEAVMVGDRLDNDVRPANLLGMRTIHVRQGGSGAQRPRDASEQPTFSVDTVPKIVPLFL